MNDIQDQMAALGLISQDIAHGGGQQAAALIHNIPSELFIDILLLVIQPPFNLGSGYRRTIRQLASIAKYWYRTISSCPSFWTRIESIYTPEEVDLFLRKSGSAPLHILWNKGPREVVSPDGFFATLSAHAARWAEVQFEGIPTDGVIEALQCPVPALEELTLNFAGFAKKTWSMPDLEGRPTLRRLVLQRVSVKWDSYRPSGLTFLHLKSIRTDSPSILELLDMITAAPALRVLILDDIKAHSTDPDDTSDGTAVDWTIPTKVSSLHILHLTDIPSSTTYALLTQLDLPHCRQLVCNQAPKAVFRKSNSPLSRILVPFFQNAPSIALLIQGRLDLISVSTLANQQSSLFFNKACDETVSGLCMIMNTQEPMENLACISRAIATVEITAPIAISILDMRSGHAAYIPENSLSLPPTIYNELPTVCEINIAKGIDVVSMMETLSQPCLGTDETWSWPWEGLSCIGLRRYDGDRKVLINFIERRWGEETQGQRRPTKVVEFILPSNTDPGILEHVSQASIHCGC